MKRILHVVACLERGGTEAFIMNHYRALDRREYQFDFLVFREKEYPYTAEIRSLGGRIFFVTAPSVRNVGRFLKEAVPIMAGYDAIHSHVNIENAWVMAAAARSGVRVRVSHSHDTTGKEGTLPVRAYRAFQERLIKAHATHFLACSHDAGNYLYGEAFFARHSAVIHNGIHVERFTDAAVDNDLRQALGLTESPLVIGNITRFEPKKNQLFAVDIFASVLKKRPDSVLLLGGPDGGSLEAVQEKVRALGIADKVRFLGPRDDIPACLKLMDVYLFPSLYEGLGIALLEAQAAGRRCVASTGVSREADMGLGLVRYLDLSQPPEIWADCILSETKRPAGREQILDAFAQKGYSIQQSLQELRKIYDQG